MLRVGIVLQQTVQQTGCCLLAQSDLEHSHQSSSALCLQMFLTCSALYKKQLTECNYMSRVLHGNTPGTCQDSEAVGRLC